mgnify:CR=1 FL=1
MSGQATGWVLRDGPRPGDVDRNGKPYGQRARGLRSVLVTIADAANRDGQHAHPGQQAIVDGSLYSRGQVVAIINDLIAEGWLQVEEQGGGRGKATVYAVVMTHRETVRSSDGFDEGNRAVAEEKPRGGDEETARSGPLNRAVAPPLTSGDADSNVVPTEDLNADVIASDDARRLCDLLADAIRDHRGGDGRPKVTSRWVKDMDLLLRRGPLHIEDASPLTASQVATAIIYTFEHLATPDRGGFCWAKQIRSPAGLRDHYQQLRDARRERSRPSERAPVPLGVLASRAYAEEPRTPSPTAADLRRIREERGIDLSSTGTAE